MTLAARPVLGANCLSNALSGNLSQPDRGFCQRGFSPQELYYNEQWGPNIGPDTKLAETELIYLPDTFSINEHHRKLTHFLHKGTQREQVLVTAYVNTLVVPNYMMTTDQLFELATGVTPVPAGMALEEYLLYTFY